MPGAEVLRAGAGAVAFLTRLPVGRVAAFDGDDVARGAVAFPLVGAGVGAVTGGVAAGLVHVLPPLVAAGIGLAAGAALTGALHLDALADTADALTTQKDRALAIMRDHSIGAYGTVAVVLDLLVKAGALAALAAGGRALPYAVVAGALSRAAPVVLASALSSVRTEGSGAFLAGRVSPGAALSTGIVAIAIAAVVTGVHGLELAGCTVATVAVLGLFFARWLGGMTGDTLGATAELAETLALVTAAAVAI